MCYLQFINNMISTIIPVYKKTDVFLKNLKTNYPFIKEVNEHIKILNEFEQNEFDDILKMNALYYYKYY